MNYNKRFFLSTPWGCALSLICSMSMGCTVTNPEFEPGFNHDGGLITPFDPVDPVPPTPLPGDPEVVPDEEPVPVDTQGEPKDSNDPPPAEEPPPPAEDPPDPPPNQGDFGQLCTEDCPGDELCVFTSSSATSGICLQECKVADEPCAVPDPSFYAGCAKYFNPDLGEVKLCAIFCNLHGQLFPCPNQTDYKCKSYGPNLGICVAK